MILKEISKQNLGGGERGRVKAINSRKGLTVRPGGRAGQNPGGVKISQYGRCGQEVSWEGARTGSKTKKSFGGGVFRTAKRKIRNQDKVGKRESPRGERNPRTIARGEDGVLRSARRISGVKRKPGSRDQRLNKH